MSRDEYVYLKITNNYINVFSQKARHNKNFLNNARVNTNKIQVQNLVGRKK